jgi:hypothetical protein
MERKSFLGLVIGALIGLVLLFAIYWFFFQDTETGKKIRNSVSNFFPIGGDSDVVVPPGDDGIPGDNPINIDGIVIIPKLRQISEAPASGYIAFDRGTSTKVMTGTSTFKLASTTEMVARYIDKATGQVYETNENILSVNRISNTTLGIFDQATFSNSQSFVARRFNIEKAEIDTYIGSLVRIGTTTELRTTGTYFPRSPETMAVRGTSIFSLYEYPLNSEGTLTQVTPIKEVKVFASPISGWNAEWINRDTLLLTTKPSAGYDGYAYSLTPSSGRKTELFGPKPGLTARVNNTLTAALRSESYGDTFALFFHNLSKNTFIQSSSPTLPEKCIFSTKNVMIAYCAVPRPMPRASYPDDWYKGKILFDDAIVKIDIEKNIETPIVNLAQEGGVQIDAINLSFNDKETFLLFQNKRDGFVWSYDLR